MNSRYLFAGFSGAAVSAGIRLIFANAQVAAIGIVVFIVVFGALILLGRGMNWPEAPVMNAVIATIATTVAYILTDHQP